MKLEKLYLSALSLPIFSEVLAKLTLELQMCHCGFLNSLLFQHRKVVNVHIDHSGIKKKPKNSMPPFVRAGLTSIGCSQLINNINAPHECGIFKMNGGCTHLFTNSTILM